MLSGLIAIGGGLGEPTEISDTAGLLQLREAIMATGLGVRCGIFDEACSPANSTACFCLVGLLSTLAWTAPNYFQVQLSI